LKIRFLSALAAKDADEAQDGVRLPASGFHDLAQRCALGALHHRDDLSLLIGEVRSRLLVAFLARATFFAALRFLAGLRPSLGCAALGSGLLVFSDSIVFVLIGFSFAASCFAVVTFITPVSRNSKQNL
jgi:hypothetical protein